MCRVMALWKRFIVTPSLSVAEGGDIFPFFTIGKSRRRIQYRFITSLSLAYSFNIRRKKLNLNMIRTIDRPDPVPPNSVIYLG